MSRARRIAVLGLALAAALAVAAAAEPKEAHKAGVTALAAGRFAEAEGFFRQAIGERSEEGLVGVLRRRYFPHYYLGVALVEQGDCQGALEAWGKSQAQAQIQRTKELYEDLQRRQRGCRDLLANVEAGRAAVEQALESARQAAASLESLRRKPELASGWRRGSPSLADRKQQAEELLEQARQQMQAATEATDLVALGEAAATAAQAANDLEAVLAAARDRLRAADAAAASSLEALERAEGNARKLLTDITYLAPYPNQVGSRRTAVRELLDETGTSKGAARPSELDALKERLTVAVGRLRRAAKRPPRTLRQAAEAYLRGAYQEVLDLLAESSFEEARARAHACILQAASRHALFVLTGSADGELLARAQGDAVACFELPAAPSLPEAYFSPRFRDFYLSTLEEHAARAAELDELADPATSEADPDADADAGGGR